MKGARYSRGVGLVELMVALAIGLVIILGAGKLYLTGFQGFRNVETISTRQAALTFAVDVLIRDIRRASVVDLSGSDPLEVTVEGVTRSYSLVDVGDSRSLYLTEGSATEPVVDGFRDADAAFDIQTAAGTGAYQITFGLVGESTDIVFHAVNRATALNN